MVIAALACVSLVVRAGAEADGAGAEVHEADAADGKREARLERLLEGHDRYQAGREYR